MSNFKSVCLIICLSTHVLSLRLKQSHNPAASLASAILSKHFSSFLCVAVIVEDNEAGSWFSMHLRLPENSSQLFASLDPDSKASCYSPTLSTILDAAFQQACTGFVVRLSDPACFLEAWKSACRRSLHRHSARLLVLPVGWPGRASPSLARSPHLRFVADTLVVDAVRSGPNESDITVQLVTSDWRSGISLVAECKLHECTKRLDFLYTDKVFDLKNTELRVATFTYEPYAILEPLDGTEVRIALEFCSRRNCTLRPVTDAAQWGQINDNGTGDGILGAVAEERASVGLGALYLWYHEYQFLDFSAPYVRTGITCLAPAPRPLSALLLPVRPFEPAAWAALAASLAAAALALSTFRRLDRALLLRTVAKGRVKRDRQGFADAVLKSIGLALAQPIGARRAEPPSTRTLLFWLHVTFLLVASGYGSGLASILAVPSYERPVDTVQELADSGLSWGATHDAWVFSLREAADPPASVLAGRFRALPKEALHRHSLADDFAFSVERLPAGHFAVGDYITEESMAHLRLMKEDIYFEYCILVFPKGSPHLQPFNRLIHRLLSSGILLFWEGEVSRRFLRSPVQSAIKESSLLTSRAHRLPTTSLRVRHLQGAFILLAGGLGVATLVAIAEVLLFVLED